MTPEQLKKRLAGSVSLTDSTLEIWSYALDYIYDQGWADITDDGFIEEAKFRFKITTQSLMRHLRRMSKQGLLSTHRLMESPGLFAGLLDGHSAPRVFVRYTLPGMDAQVLDSRSDSPRIGRRGHDLTAKEQAYWDTLFANFGKPNKTRHDNPY